MNLVHALIAALSADADKNLTAQVTPPRFDNDKSLATTEFVQRALGSMAGVKYVVVPYTLTIEDAGKFIIASGVGTVTYPQNLFPAGVGCAISAQVNGNDITVAHAMPFSYGGTQVPSISLKANENVSIISQGNGASPLVYAGGLRSSPDFASLVSGSGYQRFPSGITLQWGATNGVASGAKTVPLNIAAANVYAVIALVTSSVVGYTATTSDYTINSFNLHTWQNANTRADAATVWIAITN